MVPRKKGQGNCSNHKPWAQTMTKPCLKKQTWPELQELGFSLLGWFGRPPPTAFVLQSQMSADWPPALSEHMGTWVTNPSHFCSTFCSQELKRGLNSPLARTDPILMVPHVQCCKRRALCRDWKGIALKPVVGLGAGDCVVKCMWG